MSEFFNNDSALAIELIIFASITIFFTGRDRWYSRKRKNIALGEICHGLYMINSHLRVFQSNYGTDITNDFSKNDEIVGCMLYGKRISKVLDLAVNDLNTQLVKALIPLSTTFSNVMLLGSYQRHDVDGLLKIIEYSMNILKNQKIDIEKYKKEYDKYKFEPLDPPLKK